MEIIDISASPNVALSVTVDGFAYEFLVRHFRGMTYATITDANGNLISGPVRCCNRQWILPYPAYNGSGNFMFIDENGQYPDFRNFGTTCSLVYFSAEDIANGLDEQT